VNNNEVASIVKLVAAADGRNVTAETYGAWAMVIGHLDVAMARDAAILAMADVEIHRVEPKHILGKVAKIKDAVDASDRREKALTFTASEPSPLPICEHGVKMLSCKTCERELMNLWVCSAHSEIYVKCLECHSGAPGMWLEK